MHCFFFVKVQEKSHYIQHGEVICVASPFLPLLCKSCFRMIMLKGLQKWKQYVLLLSRIYCKLRVYCKLRYLVILILNLLFCYQVAHTVRAKVVIVYHESCELKPCIEKTHEFVFTGCVRSFVGTDPCVRELKLKKRPTKEETYFVIEI